MEMLSRVTSQLRSLLQPNPLLEQNLSDLSPTLAWLSCHGTMDWCYQCPQSGKACVTHQTAVTHLAAHVLLFSQWVLLRGVKNPTKMVERDNVV